MFEIESITWEVSIIGLSVSLFTIISITAKPFIHKTDLLLGAWLVLLNIPLIHTLMSHLDMLSATFNMLTNPMLNLLHGPILYFYVRTLISEKPATSKTDLLHLLPFAIIYPLFMLMAHPKPMMPLPNRLDNDVGPVGEHGVTSFFEPIFIHFGLINSLVFVAYAIITITLLRKHQTRIAELFSQNDSKISLSWVYALPATFAVMVVINIINEELIPSSSQVSAHTLHMVSFLTISIVLCFFGVKQKPVFYFKGLAATTDKTTSKEPVDSPQENTCKDDNKLLSDGAMQDIIEKMRVYMETQKPYLEPDFTVYALADQLNIPRRLLSLVLNNGLSKNFYQYVNEFRINEVKTLLETQNNSQLTILDVAFQAGFKSKSSFNSLFKQHCDLTPTQYRKMLVTKAAR
ncbi:helix-turn-helix domain-containing protein [Paraglaciecola sp. 2405UD69-4]|uniref:helix-turn-helix domain-containing protein n=1 Tax=Paraglaciecola sp. 2405UD69-4 TaxID=3391836 RepID=UPI0039C9EC53